MCVWLVLSDVDADPDTHPKVDSLCSSQNQTFYYYYAVHFPNPLYHTPIQTMMAKQLRKEASTAVLQLIDAGEYQVTVRRDVDEQDPEESPLPAPPTTTCTVRFGPAQTAAVRGTRLYTPEDLAALMPLVPPPPSTESSAPSSEGSEPLLRPLSSSLIVRVTVGTTQTEAQALWAASDDDGGQHVALLNFASARNPGGGFLSGAKAQEEDLCRCSGLYPCLLQCKGYYKANQSPGGLYTDHAIFSPRVPFFKTDGDGEGDDAFLSQPFFVSVITIPAPNTRAFIQQRHKERCRRDPPQTDATATTTTITPAVVLVDEDAEQLRQTFYRRWCHVLCLARAHGVTRLVLGAWGCGAFGGDPVMASTTARQAILDVIVNGDGATCEGTSSLIEIVFVIPETGLQSPINLETFRATFAEFMS
jgi:uncharacterized protein (TIGR02452 family)